MAELLTPGAADGPPAPHEVGPAPARGAFDPRRGLGSLRLPGPGPWTPDPDLEILLDPERLTAAVGRPVRATRLRPKPGVKHVAALADPQTGAVVGWVQVLIGPTRVKIDKARMVAEQVGLAYRLHERELPGGALLAWGPVETDPRLARALAGLDLAGATVLRYNPLRRLVLRVGESVVRVTDEPHRSRWSRAVSALTEHGVPVLRPATPEAAAATGLNPHGRVSVWRWVEGRDLSVRATEAEQRAAGRLLADLHRVPAHAVTDLELEPRAWPEARAAAESTVAQLEQVAPELGRAARAVLEELPSARGEGEDVVLHGDFSLDQCLAGTDGGIVLGDLDRLCRGPREVDLGSLWAVALIEGTSVQAVQEAYGAPAPHACWVTAALLSRVSEPWRAQGHGWAAEVGRRTALAASVLADGVGFRAPVRDAGTTDAQDAGTTDAEDAATADAETNDTSTKDDSPTGSMIGSAAGWRVPPTVRADRETLQVRRAWPVGERPRVAVEGPDEQGRLRAATVDRGGKVRLLPAGEDPRLPALTEVARRGLLVVHRAGRRAVVALPDRYAKVLRPGRAADVARASEAGQDLVGAAGLAAPSVLGHDDSVVELSVLPGRPVHELADDPAWTRIWQTWASAWTRIQGLGGGSTTGLARHTAADEAQVLRMWAARAAATGMLDGTPWPGRLEQAAQLLEGSSVGDDGGASSPTPRLVVTHRDLHDQQLLWDGHRLGALDLDTLCLAEPALDPVNLAVHADLRHAQGLWPAPAATPVVDAVDRVLDAACVPAERRLLAERATVARLAAVYSFRPSWRDRVLDWADRRWREMETVQVRTG